MSTAVTFSALAAFWSAVTRDLRSLGITDCPVTAMTVTRCDGRDITGVQYPPIWAAVAAGLLAIDSAQIREFWGGTTRAHNADERLVVSVGT
jgi:hypothetical protein